MTVKLLNTTPLPSRIFGGGGMNNFFDPSLSMKFFNDGGGSYFYKYLQTKHEKWIFSATVHLTNPGRYLKADHFGKKLDMGGGPFKNAKG